MIFATLKSATFFTWQNLLPVAAFAAVCAFTFHGSKEERTVSVSADKMNVLYIGVDNPLTLAVEGIPDDKVTASSDELVLTKIGRGKYNAVAKKPGTASLLVHGEGFEPKTLFFRVKRIPEPVVMLENPDLYFKTEGNVTAAEFKKTVGVMLNMCLDFDNTLEVVEFSVVRVSKDEDPVEVICRDRKLNDMARSLIEKAKPGDTYYFDEVKIKYEGDAATRKLNSMVFKIQ